jgi:anti-sigma factor RsiW
MAEHPGPADFARFVRGELAPRDEAAFEAHVAACEACAGRLVGEARLELGLAEVAALGPKRARGARAGAALVASASLAAAGAVLVAAAGLVGAARPADVGASAAAGEVAITPRRAPPTELGLGAPSHSPLDGASEAAAAP